MKSKIIIPTEFMGVPVSQETMDKVLANAEVKKERTRNVTPASANVGDKSEYIILEGRQHGSYSYDDLIVCMHRLGFGPDVEKEAGGLGLNVSNISKEKDGTDYIGNINWENALKLNLALGNVTLTPRQGIDLMIDLKEGIRGAKKLYDAKGKEVGAGRIKRMYDEIWQVREPLRGEWLDAKFLDNNGMNILYGHELDNRGNLKPNYNQPLEGCLAQDGLVEIGSVNWQGMFTKASNKGNFSFYCPKNGKVARFGAGSDRANLNCNGNPTNLNDWLGVRAARAKN